MEIQEEVIEEEYDVTTNDIMSFLKVEALKSEKRFTSLESRMDSIEEKVDDLGKTVKRLEIKVDVIDKKTYDIKMDTATLLKNKGIINKQEGLEYIRGIA